MIIFIQNILKYDTAFTIAEELNKSGIRWIAFY